VAALSDLVSEGESFGSVEREWLSAIFGATEVHGGFVENVIERLDHISSAVGKYSEWFSSTGRGCQPNATNGGSRDIHDSYILDAYVYTLVSGRTSSRKRISKDDIKDILNGSRPPGGADSSSSDFNSKVCNAFEAGMRRRRFAITKKGYIGAVPEQAELGDQACVLFGCNVPVLLRKRADEAEYAFVGESYLHGFMDVEAIALQGKGDLKEQKFILKKTYQIQRPLDLSVIGRNRMERLCQRNLPGIKSRA
jgi:hypothetical protein